MILNERMTLLYCFVTALADGSEGAAFLVGRSGHSGCAGRRGSAAGARRAHHARTNTDLPSGRRPCMRRTLRLGGQRFAKPATASRPSRRSLERDASTRKRSSSRKAKVRPLSCRRICPSRGRRRSRRSSVRFHGGLFESPLTDSNRRPPPYHGNGSQPTATVLACSAASATSRFADDCHRLQPRGSIKAPSADLRSNLRHSAQGVFPTDRRDELVPVHRGMWPVIMRLHSHQSGTSMSRERVCRGG